LKAQGRVTLQREVPVATLIRFDERDELTEDLADIASVDLIDDQHERLFRMKDGALERFF